MFCEIKNTVCFKLVFISDLRRCLFCEDRNFRQIFTVLFLVASCSLESRGIFVRVTWSAFGDLADSVYIHMDIGDTVNKYLLCHQKSPVSQLKWSTFPSIIEVCRSLRRQISTRPYMLKPLIQSLGANSLSLSPFLAKLTISRTKINNLAVLCVMIAIFFDIIVR